MDHEVRNKIKHAIISHHVEPLTSPQKTKSPDIHSTAALVIENFEVNANFSRNLWDLAENYPTKEIPFRNLKGEYKNEEYHVNNEEWNRFIHDIQMSISTLIEISQSPEIKNNNQLSDICNKLVDNLIKIMLYQIRFLQ